MSSNLLAEIEKAFDYRGDVTLTLKDGRTLVGFVFNRETRPTSRCSEPFVELMQNGADNLLVKCSEIVSVAFTGEDPAAGKSWEDWMTKEEGKKLAAAKNGQS